MVRIVCVCMVCEGVVTLPPIRIRESNEANVDNPGVDFVIVSSLARAMCRTFVIPLRRPTIDVRYDKHCLFLVFLFHISLANGQHFFISPIGRPAILEPRRDRQTKVKLIRIFTCEPIENDAKSIRTDGTVRDWHWWSGCPLDTGHTQILNGRRNHTDTFCTDYIHSMDILLFILRLCGNRSKRTAIAVVIGHIWFSFADKELCGHIQCTQWADRFGPNRL